MLAPAAIKVADKRLTKKQREFAQAIVDGETGAGAYRKAYNKPDAKPQTAAVNGCKLSKNTKIQQTIAALQRAKELADSLSAAQIRALILSDLLKHSQDEDQKLTDRLAALRLLGQLSDVAAYTERKEVLNIKASVDIKQQLLEKLKFIGHSATPEADSHKPAANSADDNADAESLLNELRSDPDVIEGELIESGSDFQALSDKPEADSGAANS
jgi:phage terminase small subunit